MIPTIVGSDDISLDIQDEKDQPTFTYAMDLDTRVQGTTDNLKAMEQVIFKILQTERYHHSKVYSDNFGVEFASLIGQPTTFVIPEIQRRIREALTWDERILNVYDFDFSGNKSKIHVDFTVHTIFGEVKSSAEVTI